MNVNGQRDAVIESLGSVWVASESERGGVNTGIVANLQINMGMRMKIL